MLQTTHDDLAAFMDRHQWVALMFSAGKDSAACLKLLWPYIDRVTVIWANPGRPYPEVVDYMADIRRRVPHFVEALGNQPLWIEANGWPVDVLPWEATPMGRACHRDPKAIPLVTSEACRWANMWEPALHAVRSAGVSGVIKGEKLTDRPLPPLQTVFEGREYFRPLLNWSDQDVFTYLGRDLPPGYARGLKGSLDCMTCTAYIGKNPQRLIDLRSTNPAAFAEVAPVLRYVRELSGRHALAINKVLNRELDE